MLCGRAPGENQSPFLLGIFTSISELDGRGPPACSPAFSLRVLGKTEGSLPVKLELSFGAPIPSTADSDGGQRKRRERERESTTGISHKEVQARGKHQRHPTAGPTPLCPRLPGGCAPRYQVLGGSATQWHTEADAWSVQTRGSFCAWPHSPLGQGSEDKR